jgi:tRNA dimethylallyltransferase
MLPPPFHKARILTGPTASGKTRLALELARRLDAEIISMDSMALYRRLDIGTAKPTAAERALVPHHLVDVLQPWEAASVAWWLQEAVKCCREIGSRGKQVLFVGGTPLYLKTLLCGLFDGPAADVALRKRLISEAAAKGTHTLHERLAQVDPASAARLHPNDMRRLIRALEVFEITGQPISDWQGQWGQASEVRSHESEVRSQGSADASASCLWLDLPRHELYERINRRVEAMFEAGLVAEVEGLQHLERPLSPGARQALGYKEVLDHLEGRINREETIVRVQTRTRQFAKRQITWFRHLPGCQRATSELTQTLWLTKMKS